MNENDYNAIGHVIKYFTLFLLMGSAWFLLICGSLCLRGVFVCLPVCFVREDTSLTFGFGRTSFLLSG